jgi:hypothetical protein
MGKISYLIDIKLPTLNEYINLERTNGYAAAALKKKYTNYCAIYANNVQSLEGLYDIVLDWETANNREDPDNLYFGIKFILDGLIKVQKNGFKDGRKNIRRIYHNIKTTGKFQVTVNLIEIRGTSNAV